MKATVLLDEIRFLYFSNQDEIRDDVNVSFEDIINLELKLFKIELKEGSNALTEAIDSFIDVLKQIAKSQTIKFEF